MVSLIAIVLIFLTGGVTPVLAQTTTQVNAQVVSSVSATKSAFVSDLAQLPADGTSTVILTATVVDENNQPLPQKEVIVTSNRGQIDTIRCYVGSTLSEENKTTTDANGVARCAARSLVPGEATFTATAEAIELNDNPVVTFTPLPILTKLKITVKTPGGGQVTLVEPPTPSPGTEPSHGASTDKLVDTGLNLQIPFALFIFILLMLLLVPILFLIILLLIRKIRRLIAAERKSIEQEKEWLAKIYQLEQQVSQKADSLDQKAATIAQKVDDSTAVVTDAIAQQAEQAQSPQTTPDVTVTPEDVPPPPSAENPPT